MKFTKRQRENISKALFDISKLVVAILILGPLVTAEQFNSTRLIGGCAVFVTVFVVAILFDKGE